MQRSTSEMVRYLLPRVQRRLQGSAGGEREDGVEGGAAARGHPKAGSGRSKPAVEGGRTQRRRDEEGKGPGIGGGA